MIPSEKIGRYVITFIDFWKLRPRRFVLSYEESPSKYLPPFQFWGFSLIILFALFVAEIALTIEISVDDVRVMGQKVPAEALATWHLTFLVFLTVVFSLLYRAVSRIWPIRGNATFRSILELQCYTHAILIPLAAFLFLVSPFIGKESRVLWGIVVTVVYSLLTVFPWNLPAVAVANGVSSLRMFAGMLFWVAVLYVFAFAILGGIAVVSAGAG